MVKAWERSTGVEREGEKDRVGKYEESEKHKVSWIKRKKKKKGRFRLPDSKLGLDTDRYTCTNALRR